MTVDVGEELVIVDDAGEGWLIIRTNAGEMGGSWVEWA